MVRGAGQILAGLLVLSGLAVLSAQAATSSGSSPQCGRPEDAPGFETPARVGFVPNVGCMDLQLAQDKAQAAGFTRMATVDAAGLRRRPTYDQDWVVVAQSPPAGTRASSRTEVVFHALRYGDEDAPPVPDRRHPGRLPRLTCFDLQEAQDTLQSAGFTRMSSRDASGGNRRQLVDRDWTVTGESPSAGGTYRKATEIVLQAVKDGERSACSVR